MRIEPEGKKGNQPLVSRGLQALFTLARESLVYGLSSIIARSISLFLVPIYTRIFSPHDYGILSMIQAIIGFLSIFLGLGAEASVGAFFYDHSEMRSRRRLIASYIFLQLLSAVFLGIGLYALRLPVSRSFLEDEKNSTYLTYGVFILLLSSLQGVIFNLFRLFRKPTTLMILNTAMSLIQVGAAFILVVVLRMGVSGSLIGQIIGYGVGFTVGLYLLREWISLREIHSGEILQMVRVGVPYMISALSLWCIGMINRFFIEHYLTLADVGLFSVANSLSQVFALFTGAFQMAYGPYALSIKDRPDSLEIYRQILTAFLAVGFGAGLIFTLFAPEIILILATPTYLSAQVSVPFLVLYHLSVSLGYIASLGSWIAKKTENLLLPTLLGGALSILGNLLLIPCFGIAGAAFASVLGISFHVTYLFFLSQRAYPIPYRFAEIFLVLALYATGVGLASFYELRPFAVSSLVIKITLGGGYALALFLVGIIPPRVLRSLVQVVYERIRQQQ